MFPLKGQARTRDTASSDPVRSSDSAQHDSPQHDSPQSDSPPVDSPQVDTPQVDSPQSDPAGAGAVRMIDPMIVGAACGVLSAIGYTASNVCLRAVSSCDPIWVSAIKAVPAVLLIGPWLLVLLEKRVRLLASWRLTWWLVIAGLFGQLCGNVFFQSSLGIIGIAMAVPVTLGAMIVFSAVFGWLVLGESVSYRAIVAICVLLGALAVLAAGAGDAYHSVTGGDLHTSAAVLMLVAGVVGAAMAGVAYAALGVAMRSCLKAGAPMASTLMVVSFSGMLALGAWSYQRIGLEQMLATNPVDFGLMLGAGICNAGAFLALTKALQSSPVWFVNSINASQATMGLVCGVFIFGEAASGPLLIGVGLTIAGLMLMRKRKKTGARS